MKTLLISPSFPPASEGEAEHALQIARRLAEVGHQVTVLTNRRDRVRQVPTVRVDALAQGWGFAQLPTLWRYLREQRADAVLLIYTAWLFDNSPMVTFLPTLARWACPSARVLVMVETEHGPPVAGLAGRMGRKLLALLAGGKGVDYGFGTLLRDADVVVALGPTILDKLAAHHAGLQQKALLVPPPPLVAVPHAIGAQERRGARAQLGLGPDVLVLAYFGYVYPGKGVETLLAALQLLAQAGQSVHLLMVGGGRNADGSSNGQHAAYEARMVERSRQGELNGRVSWRSGYESGSDAPSADLLAADIAVLPFDDGAELRRSSIAVVASLGLPIVSTFPRQPEPAFIDGESMCMVAPQNLYALAAALQSVAANPAQARRLSLGAQDLVRQWYSWASAIDRIDAALRPHRRPT
jgi:polysaccharide biosynthesis protein PslF